MITIILKCYPAQKYMIISRLEKVSVHNAQGLKGWVASSGLLVNINDLRTEMAWENEKAQL